MIGQAEAFYNLVWPLGFTITDSCHSHKHKTNWSALKCFLRGKLLIKSTIYVVLMGNFVVVLLDLCALFMQNFFVFACEQVAIDVT